MHRREFLNQLMVVSAGSALIPAMRRTEAGSTVMTVRGPIDAHQMGRTLAHEHMLVDFSGAANYDPTRWDIDSVTTKVLPYLAAVKDAGCDTIVDCTPVYLGRDPQLLTRLSEQSGLHFLTNTGYYGGSDEKYLPAHAFTESPEQLADRWIAEWYHGIDSSTVRPGFMKISVSPGPLTPMSRKLITAAALAHLDTGLTILSHTGPYVAAREQLEILEKHGIQPQAFVWVHAQNERDKMHYLEAARAGCWVSLDGLRDNNVSEYVNMLTALRKAGSLNRVLVSHDAGWYEPGKPDGGMFRGFTTLFERLVPTLLEGGFSDEDIRMLTAANPQAAFAISPKKK